MGARATLTVVSGTTVTSAWGNAIRDHIVPFTTSDDVSSNGQIAFNTNSGRLVARLGGVNYPIAGAMPRVRVRRSVGQAIATGTLTAIVFDTEVYDSDNAFTGGTRLTAPIGGRWLVTYSCDGNSAASAGLHAAYVLENGTTRHAENAMTVAAGGAFGVVGSAVVSLAAGGYVELWYFTTAATGATAMSGVANYLQMDYRGPI